MNDEKIDDLNARLREILAELTDSRSSRKAVAAFIPYNEARYGQWLNKKWDGSIAVYAYARALLNLGVDLPTAIRKEAYKDDIDDTEGLPEHVRTYLNQPLARVAIKPDERAVLIALARAGAYPKDNGQIEQDWQDLLKRLKRESEIRAKADPSLPPPQVKGSATVTRKKDK